MVARDLARLGVGLEIIDSDPASTSRRLAEQDFAAALVVVPAEGPGLDRFLLGLRADAAGNASALADPALDETLGRLRRAATAEEHALALGAVGARLDELAPVVPLFRRRAVALARPELRGLVFTRGAVDPARLWRASTPGGRR